TPTCRRRPSPPPAPQRGGGESDSYLLPQRRCIADRFLGMGKVKSAMAVLSNLPCVSIRNERLAPPASASYSRKLSAHKRGSSKRSTRLHPKPPKKSATRSLVSMSRRYSKPAGV